MSCLADLCTALRVLLAPVLACSLGLPRDEAGWLPTAIYLFAASSDYLDGTLARAAGTASQRGRAFDHGSDALLLFPAFAVLAQQQRVPFVLPVAAVIAFSLYVVDGLRRGRGATIELTASRSGALGGVLNYALVGAAAGAVVIDVGAVDQVIYAAAFAVAAVNATAAVERLWSLVMSAPGSPVAERGVRAPRSLP